jgi:hypothetical protein
MTESDSSRGAGATLSDLSDTDRSRLGHLILPRTDTVSPARARGPSPISADSSASAPDPRGIALPGTRALPAQLVGSAPQHSSSAGSEDISIRTYLNPIFKRRRPRSQTQGSGGLDEVTREMFEFGPVLGSGVVGKVRLCTRCSTGERLAVKIMKKRRIAQLHLSQYVGNEISILSELRHPNIVRLYTTFSDPECIYVVMELVPGGELFHQIRQVCCEVCFLFRE